MMNTFTNAIVMLTVNPK